MICRQLHRAEESRDSWRHDYDDLKAAFVALRLSTETQVQALLNELERLRDREELKTQAIHDLTTDRDVLILYGHALRGQITGLDVAPVCDEPALITSDGIRV